MKLRLINNVPKDTQPESTDSKRFYSTRLSSAKRVSGGQGFGLSVSVTPDLGRSQKIPNELLLDQRKLTIHFFFTSLWQRHWGASEPLGGGILFSI